MAFSWRFLAANQSVSHRSEAPGGERYRKFTRAVALRAPAAARIACVSAAIAASNQSSSINILWRHDVGGISEWPSPAIDSPAGGANRPRSQRRNAITEIVSRRPVPCGLDNAAAL